MGGSPLTLLCPLLLGQGEARLPSARAVPLSPASLRQCLLPWRKEAVGRALGEWGAVLELGDLGALGEHGLLPCLSQRLRTGWRIGDPCVPPCPR